MKLSQLSSRVMRWRASRAGMISGATWMVVLVAGLLAIGAAVWEAHRSQEIQADSAASRLAESVARDVAGAVEQFDLTLRTVMEGDETPANRTFTPERRSALLFERTPRARDIAFIDVLGADGSVLATLTPGDSTSNWAKQDYFVTQRDNPATGLYVGLPYSLEHESKIGLTLSRRITARDGSFAGVVVMGVRLAGFRDLFDRHEFGERDLATLLRDDGTVMMQWPFDVKDIGHPIEPTSPFYAFIRGQRPSFSGYHSADQLERRLIFRRVGTLPLTLSLATPAAVSYPAPVLWLTVLGAVLIGTAFALLLRRMWREKLRCEAAERQNQEKSRYLTMLSHELRTPLHGVLGYADQLLRDSKLNVAQVRQIGEIVRSAKHMRDVVNVVLDYARVEALGPALHMQEIDVLRVLEECLAFVEPSARARGLETRISAAPGAPVQFVTSELQLRQILINLLTNAVKYTPKGSVRLRLMGGKEHLTIEVADTGIGIPEDQRHHLFNEYERFGAERTSIEGTGLGLAIAHRLARRMGGQMGHRDNPGGGSVFWLKLPSAKLGEPETVYTSGEADPMAGFAILVVDDSDMNREVAEEFLRAAGHDAIGTCDGYKAVRLAASRDFDLILMDMRMPGLSGLEATRQIRRLDGPRARVPIVAVTANALDEHAEECRLAGMTGHLAKPFTQTELLAVVGRAVARSQHAPRGEETTVDADCVTQLVTCMGSDAVVRLFDCLASRIETLLRHLEDLDHSASLDAVSELAHELKGSAGTLGFTALSAAADRLQRAIVRRAADVDELAIDVRRHATDALKELRYRRLLEVVPQG
jgi:signal transduction histidine kinase/DNA-binding response OmpR family regulator